MSKKSILVATDNKKAVEFLIAYFADTQSIPTVVRSKADLSILPSCRPDFIFVQGDWADQRILGYLKQFKSDHPKVKCFGLGSIPEGFSWDDMIELPIDEKLFRKVIFSKIEFSDKIKLIIVDDEVEIIDILKDYLEVRNDPPFQVMTAPNGLEGFKLIEKNRPDCLILDIKMPVRTGVELYRDLAKAGSRIPTIIFIDSTVADDILEIREWGAPVFVEKGGPSSSMPDMLALIKKLVVFS